MKTAPSRVELRENGVVDGGVQGVPDDCGSFKLHGSRQPMAAVSRKKVCRNMAKPRASDFMETKRLVRFPERCGRDQVLVRAAQRG